ncbi:C2 domain-containing protein [Drosera capensis]
MVLTEVSIVHHVAIVLVLFWVLNEFNCCHPVICFLSLIYLYQVNERYVMRLRRKLQHEERKQANQRRVLSDSETVWWLNHALEKIWTVCVEEIISQRIFLPIIPWFLDKYKPWTVQKAVVQQLYLGRTPPMFTQMRILRHTNDDDHLVLQLGLNFLTADDMSGILDAKLRKRLGFGMSARMHITGMHVEGKVLIGVKFLRKWPFIGRLRVCFAEPPYFQMTVKPIFNHGVDVTELPGIAGWLDKLLAIAIEETLVEPNMLVVDLEKYIAPQEDPWFSVDVKEPVGYAKVEVIEGSDMKPSDLNGLADPYVKGQFGQYRFQTKIQRKTLTPKWQEDFKIPICSWEAANVLAIEVHDKDHFVDDYLGACSVNIGNLRDGQRHDLWLPLQNIKTGRLHLAITVLEVNTKVSDATAEQEKPILDDVNSVGSGRAESGSEYISSRKSDKVLDSFEPINVEGQNETGIWIHHPGSAVSQTWEPRKGKSRQRDTQIVGEAESCTYSPNNTSKGSQQNGSSSGDDDHDGNKAYSSNFFHRGIQKLNSAMHRSHRKVDHTNSFGDSIPSPHPNLKPVSANRVGVNFVLEDLPPAAGAVKSEVQLSTDGNSPDRCEISKTDVKGPTRNIFRQARRSLKSALSRKGSKRFLDDEEERDGSNSSDEGRESSSSSFNGQTVKGIPMVPSTIDDAKNVTGKAVAGAKLDRLASIDDIKSLTPKSNETIGR